VAGATVTPEDVLFKRQLRRRRRRRIKIRRVLNEY
jgi:hypothetical protein